MRYWTRDAGGRMIALCETTFIEQVAGEPAQVIADYWKPISKEQLARREAGEPLTHRLVRLPHLSRRSERLLGPLQGLLLDG